MRTGRPPQGVSSGSVISTRFAWPLRNSMSRTKSPTANASSTSEAKILGVDTATSTPQAPSKSHSLRGSLTRATTRDTANSVFASSESTTFALSSPVAAITTSNSSRCTDSSRLNSQASPRRQSAPGIASTSTWLRLRSIRVTSWRFSTNSRAIERPTAPAPAMATFIPRLRPRAVVRQWPELRRTDRTPRRDTPGHRPG